MVVELCGNDSNFFSLNEMERGLIRKDAVKRYLAESPAWLIRWENSLADLSKEELNMVRQFACNLIASRMAAIWQSEIAQAKKTLLQENQVCGKKRGRNADALKKCDDCQSELQMIWICPSCDTEQPKKKTVVFLP